MIIYLFSNEFVRFLTLRYLQKPDVLEASISNIRMCMNKMPITFYGVYNIVNCY